MEPGFSLTSVLLVRLGPGKVGHHVPEHHARHTVMYYRGKQVITSRDTVVLSPSLRELRFNLTTFLRGRQGQYRGDLVRGLLVG